MPDLDTEDTVGSVGAEKVKERSIKGIVALTTRTFFLQTVNFIGTFLLTVFLAPSAFGIFYIVSAVISFFTYFSDIGLAAALVQKKEALTQKDLRTTFTIQQILVIILVLLIILNSNFIAKFYNLDQKALQLLQILSLSLFLTSLKTIPSVLLERKLEFQKLVLPQVAESIVFNLTAVILAWQGRGVESFSYAVLFRSLTGLILIYIVSPWKIGIEFSKESLRHLLNFGIPYQLNSFMALVKDDLMTVILGKLITPSGVGFLGWSKKWAEAPLRFFMDNIIKISFPAYSRLQDNPEKLKKAVELSLFVTTALVFPSSVGLCLVAPSLVQIIPKYFKWEPALIGLYLFSISSIWAAISTPLTNLLNAIGKIKTTFKLMLMWTFLTWLLTPVLAIRMGFSGVALSQALIGFSGIVVIIFVKRHININLIASIKGTITASAVMGLFIYFLLKFLPLSFSAVLLSILAGVLIYSLLLILLEKEKLLFSVNSLRTVFGKAQ